MKVKYDRSPREYGCQQIFHYRFLKNGKRYTCNVYAYNPWDAEDIFWEGREGQNIEDVTCELWYQDEPDV